MLPLQNVACVLPPRLDDDKSRPSGQDDSCPGVPMIPPPKKCSSQTSLSKKIGSLQDTAGFLCSVFRRLLSSSCIHVRAANEGNCFSRRHSNLQYREARAFSFPSALIQQVPHRGDAICLPALAVSPALWAELNPQSKEVLNSMALMTLTKWEEKGGFVPFMWLPGLSTRLESHRAKRWHDMNEESVTLNVNT